jgi:phosphohistidine phosphatase SixA
VPVYLIRHASAGDKRRWSGPDLDRPLDATGLSQAEALAEALAAAPIHRVLTSPARRCRQTVEPLARSLDLPLEALDELTPDGDADRLSPLISALDASVGVICTHGELMRPLLATVRHARTRIHAEHHDDDWLLGKGTGWALTLDPGGTIVALHHLTPTAVATRQTAWPPTTRAAGAASVRVPDRRRG